MASRRRAVTRSSKTSKHPDQRDDQKHHYHHEQLEHATTGSQSSTITATATFFLSTNPCSTSAVRKAKEVEAGEREDEEAEDGGACWSTPKAKRHRIPEIESCPPAPKKQKAVSTIGNCSVRRSSIPFCTPPELSEFFFRVSSVPNMSTV